MALTTVNITGTFNFPDATWTDYAQAEFMISGYDTDTEVVVPGVIKSTLSASGALDVDLWGNDDGLRGTVYRVNIVLHSDDSLSREVKRIDLGRIQINGDGPLDIATLLDSPVTVPEVWYSTITEAEYDAAIQAAADAAASAAEAALYDGPRFDTIPLMAAADALDDGEEVAVTSGYNGQREYFHYDASSTATADGALVVDATGMGAGRLISTRTVYTDFDEMDADGRTLATGTKLSIPGVGDYETVSSGEDMTLTGGLTVKALRGADGRLDIKALNPAGDGATDDRAIFATADSGGPVVLESGKTYRIASDITLTQPLHLNGATLKADGARVVINSLVPSDTSAQCFEEVSDGLIVVNSSVAKMDRRMYGFADDRPQCPFTWGGEFDLPTVLYMDRDGQAVLEAGYDIFDNAPTPDATYYVDYDTGSNANNGLTQGTAWQTIGYAVNQIEADGAVDIAKIILGNGPQWRASFNLMSKEYILEGDTATTIIETDDPRGQWSATGGRTNVYEWTDASLVSVGRVIDNANLTADGDPSELTLVTSIAEVEALAGSYHVDSTTIYVRPIDDRDLASGTDDDKLWPLFHVSHTTSAGARVWLDEMKVYGGARNIDAPRGLVVMRGGQLQYSVTDDTLQGQGGECYLQDTLVANGATDGCSYKLNTDPPWVLELRVTSRSHGGAEGFTNNCSTNHEGAKTVSINCTFKTCRGPVVADVYDSRRWLVGCDMSDSVSSAANGGSWDQRANILVNEKSVIWVEGGTSVTVTDDTVATAPYGEDYGLENGSMFDLRAYTVTTDTGTIYLRDLKHAHRLADDTSPDDIGVF